MKPSQLILNVTMLLVFLNGTMASVAAQTIRCADSECKLCLSGGWNAPEQSDSREPRNHPEDVPFGRERSLAVVNPVIRSSQQNVILLSGEWEFCIDQDAVGIEEHWMQPDKTWPNPRTMPVPGNWESNGLGEPGESTTWICTWDCLPRMLRNIYIGSAWYRTQVDIPADWAGQEIWLKVGGVRAQGWFWINGQPAMKTADYCGAFRVNITDLVSPGEKAVLTALVRNDVPSRMGLASACHSWGGIYRDVEIEATPAVHLANIECVGDFDQQSVDVQIMLTHPVNLAGKKVALNIAVQEYDTEKHAIDLRTNATKKRVAVTLAENGTTQLTLPIAIPDFKPWSPELPQLYVAEVQLLDDKARPIHGWVERFGVKKFEVRGKRFYLNDKPYFLRGYGDDYVYPETFISPPDREMHRKNLQVARESGFAYVRLHTHCELPEFYEAADELGIMIQPELPYYPFNGHHTTELFDFDPMRDLNELIDHYHRYVSLSVYCFGNEGHLGTPLDIEMKQHVKQRDPGRLVMHNDGGVNTPDNSDFDTPNSYCWPVHPLSSILPWEPGTFDYVEMPFVSHEYMNLGIKLDPRLAPRFTGAMLPPRPLDRYERRLHDIGLDRRWGDACLDAGHALQRHYQKEGIEAARLDPECDGYCFWTIVDVIVRYAEGDSFTAQGIFNPFWETKPHGASPADLTKSNAPTAILLKPDREHAIWVAGETIEFDLWISHFGYEDITNDRLVWQIKDGENVLLQGSLDSISLQTGDVKSLGKVEFVVPELEMAKHLTFETRLERCGAQNDWPFWAFPERKTVRLQNTAATPDLFKRLAPRYDGLMQTGTPEGDSAATVIGTLSHPDTQKAIDAGKRVLTIDGADGPANAKLGWWWIGDQTGTAFVDHAAFGDFPHDGLISPLWFRLIKRGLPIGKEMPFQNIEYISVGEGRNDYFLYVGEAQTDDGGQVLILHGIDLLTDTPEGAYLLDQMLQYHCAGNKN